MCVVVFFGLFTCDALHDLVLFVHFKKPKKPQGEVLRLLKLQASVCSFTKSSTAPCVFFTLVQMVTQTVIFIFMSLNDQIPEDLYDLFII